jgi:hypothetical protein
VSRPRTWLALAGVCGVLAIAAGAAPDGGPTSTQLRAQLASERADHGREAATYRREIRRLRHALRRDQVAEALTLASVVYGVSRRELVAVSYCEARWQPIARNGQHLGLFQLGAGFRARSPFFAVAGLDPYSPYVNALAAARVVARDGWREWQCRP